MPFLRNVVFCLIFHVYFSASTTQFTYNKIIMYWFYSYCTSYVVLCLLANNVQHYNTSNRTFNNTTIKIKRLYKILKNNLPKIYTHEGYYH
jgi:succinate dehydrogenase hydrophobic anchor subunit